MIMNCDYCGSAASEDDNYCGQCGEELIETDPTEVFHTAKECPFCDTYKAPIVLKVPRPWRILSCTECGGTYRTLELRWSGPNTLELAVKHKGFLKA